MPYHLIMLCWLEKTYHYLKYHEPLQNWPSHIILSKLLYYFAMPGLTLPVGRDRKIRTALRTNQIAAFVTFALLEKNEYAYFPKLLSRGIRNSPRLRLNITMLHMRNVSSGYRALESNVLIG